MPNNKNLKPSKRSYDDLQLATQLAKDMIIAAKNAITHTDPNNKSYIYAAKDQLRAASFILNVLEEKRRRMNSQLIVAKYGKIDNYARHLGISNSRTHALIHEHQINPENTLFKHVQAEIAQLKNDLE